MVTEDLPSDKRGLSETYMSGTDVPSASHVRSLQVRATPAKDATKHVGPRRQKEVVPSENISCDVHHICHGSMISADKNNDTAQKAPQMRKNKNRSVH